MCYWHLWGFPGGVHGKDPSCLCRRHKRHELNPWVRKIPWRRAWQPTLVFFPGESPWTEEPGRLYSPWGHKELDMTEVISTHVSLTRWTWVWVNSRSWWWTERPGVLQFMGSQRVGHDWGTVNWTEQSKTKRSSPKRSWKVNMWGDINRYVNYINERIQ